MRLQTQLTLQMHLMVTRPRIGSLTCTSMPVIYLVTIISERAQPRIQTSSMHSLVTLHGSQMQHTVCTQSQPSPQRNQTSFQLQMCTHLQTYLVGSPHLSQSLCPRAAVMFCRYSTEARRVGGFQTPRTVHMVSAATPETTSQTQHRTHRHLGSHSTETLLHNGHPIQCTLKNLTDLTTCRHHQTFQTRGYPPTLGGSTMKCLGLSGPVGCTPSLQTQMQLDSCTPQSHRHPPDGQLVSIMVQFSARIPLLLQHHQTLQTHGAHSAHPSGQALKYSDRSGSRRGLTSKLYLQEPPQTFSEMWDRGYRTLGLGSRSHLVCTP